MTRAPMVARDEEPPDARKLTQRQADYLAELTGTPVKQLAGRPIRDLDKLLHWKIDPSLLFFRRICGRVVRVEPGTGVVQGVPNATVHVEDTDCSFLGFFPTEGPWSPWWWLWPLTCRREEIATTMTDQCGRFCVWVPRWDIDRILRFRRERICFPEIFKPTLRDVLEHLGWPIELPPIKVDPNPPDPAPFTLPGRSVLERAGGLLDRPSLDRLGQLAGRRAFGEYTGELQAVLEEPGFLGSFAPPLTDDALERLERIDLPAAPSPKGKKKPEAAARLDLDLDAARATGPFLRCRDVHVAEWHPVLDVPDITFRVTQDVDLDGDEETIYAESYFDVRWNAGAIPDVTLQASPIARPSHMCDGPSIPCGNTPAIVTAGLMPLAASHHENATGHSNRVNRPRPGGLLSSPQSGPAQAPYAGTLQLHGCHDIAGAEWYRLRYSDGTVSDVPFTGLEWYAPKLTGPPWFRHVFPDADGWYKVPTAAELDDLVFPHWLLNWPTTSFPDGTYAVRLELADASKTPLAAPAGLSAPVTFRIDNRAPAVTFSQIRWRVAGGAWLPQNTFAWPFTCLVIERPANTDIEIEIGWGATAAHLRDVQISGSGCGDGNPVLLSALSTREHWHEDFGDNSVSRTTRFEVPGSADQGAYSFSIDAWSRAFNPAGDGGGPATNWLTNYSYIHSNPSVALAIIDS
ncbi:MAG TPA: hypothetical protein VD836_14605 [Solirubrobacteraceae bacterium]|nr:hypothetical protein [Solirubrobacteraceae bacterium]